jgi:hypothetical protein
VKPYTWDQEAFRGFVHDVNPQVGDIFSPLARSHINAYLGDPNPYLGDQQCPLAASSGTKETFGYAVSATPLEVQFSIDNRINPWRWNAPINTIHPVEQPSFAVVSHSADVFSQTEAILKNFSSGVDRSTHILLDYDINLTVHDGRGELGELTIADIYEHDHENPCLETTLPGLTHCKALDGPDFVYDYVSKRMIPPTIQLSLMLNFREDGVAFVLQEFMLSSFNYASTVTNATADPAFNQYIFEGGTNTAIDDMSSLHGVSFYRLKAHALQIPALNPPGNATVISGVQYVPIDFDGNGHFQVDHLSGTIDLTNYYLAAKGHGFFPGQNGPENGPAACPDFDTCFGEHNGINWAGVILESHGPFVTSVTVNTFNIRTQ